MKYKILEVNAEKKWVRIWIDFGDSETREKRMHADVTNLDTIDRDVQAWYKDYEPARAAEKANLTVVSPDVMKAIESNTLFEAR